MKNLTIIYYTSNRERSGLEERVRENILKVSGGLPIVSVSQKPIDFGKNIVVGDVGTSGFNCFRQILIACQNAKTRFVVSAEADTLYPPDYFQFIPERDDVCYRNSNLYVLGHKRDYFWKKKEGSTTSQVINREFYIKRLTKLFEGAPQWNTEEKNFPKERHRKVDIFDKITYYQTKNPVVTVKTSEAMRHYTNTDRINRESIPYWGNGKLFRDKYFNEH